MEITKSIGVPLAEGLEFASDIPHTISLAVTYRTRINSFYELPKDKRPPRDLWDKPHQLDDFFEEVFDIKGGTKSRKYLEFNSEDVE